MSLRFGMVIYWSQEDETFLIEVPELPGCVADGQSYEQAVANARVAMEEWMQTARKLGRSIPKAQGRAGVCIDRDSRQKKDNPTPERQTSSPVTRRTKHQLSLPRNVGHQPGSSGTARHQLGTAGTARHQPGTSGTARHQPGSSSSPSSPPTSPPPPQGWHSRNYLPHFEAGPSIQHITYRLADSLPKEAITRMQGQCEELNLKDSSKACELRQRIEDFLDSGHGSCILQHPDIAHIVVQSWMYFDESRYRLLAWVVMPNHVHVLIEPLDGWSIGTIVGSWKSYTGRQINGWLKRHREGREEEEKSKSQAGARRSQESQAGARRSQESQAGARRSRESQAGSRRSQERQCDLGVVQGRIWQREYWDRFIRNERHYWEVKAYIEKNPVKAGLVNTPEKWPWSSAALHRNVYAPW